MKKNKVACVVYYTDDRYDGLVSNVKNSFLKFNSEECDYYQVDYTNQEEYNNTLEHFDYAPETFLMQYIYAYEIMKKHNFNLGGEQSGHIILGKFATTGDGLLVALEVLFSLRKGKKASEFFTTFKKTPQILENIQVKDKNIINKPEVKKSIKEAKILMKGQGRILVRKSGTESKIRVMGESEDIRLLQKCVNNIVRKIK